MTGRTTADVVVVGGGFAGLQLVQDLKGRGLGVLITDHNVRETLEIVDRAYILHDGHVLMSGTTDEIVQDETVRRVYLGQNFRMN